MRVVAALAALALMALVVALSVYGVELLLQSSFVLVRYVGTHGLPAWWYALVFFSGWVPLALGLLLKRWSKSRRQRNCGR